MTLLYSATPSELMKAPLANLNEEEDGEEDKSVVEGSAVTTISSTMVTVHQSLTPPPRSSSPLSCRKSQGLESETEMYYGKVEDTCYFTSELDSD